MWHHVGCSGPTDDTPHMLTALGPPFSSKLNVGGCWGGLCKNTKGGLAKWAGSVVAQSGRLLVCKAMLVSMATCGLRNLLMPKWFEKALKRGVAAFVWQRQPQMGPEEDMRCCFCDRWKLIHQVALWGLCANPVASWGPRAPREATCMAPWHLDSQILFPERAKAQKWPIFPNF